MSWLAAGITAAGAIAGSATSAVSSGKLNKKTRKWNEKMYHAQNEYNDPINQRARLEAAGLNPHLVYGQNSGGAAGTAASPESWNPKHPDYDGSGLGHAMGQYIDARQKEVQANLLNEQIESEKTKQVLDNANTAKVLSETARTNQQKDQSDKLFEHSLQAAQLANKQTEASINSTLTTTELKVFSTHQDMAESVERILSMRAERELNPAKKAKLWAEIEALKNSSFGTYLDNQLKKMGVNADDPAWVRMGARFIDSFTEDPEGFVKDIKKKGEKIIKMTIDRWNQNMKFWESRNK